MAHLFRAKFSDVLKIVNAIKEVGNVIWSNPNFLSIIRTFSDPLYADQYYLNNTGQFGGTAGIDINAPEAWAITKGCSAIRVAVI